MITVKNEKGYTDKVSNGEAFKVDPTGVLLIFDSRSTYADSVRAYASGKWSDVAIEVKTTDDCVKIDFDKLETLLQPEEPLSLTYFEFQQLDRKFVYSVTSGGETTHSWKGHPITITNPFVEAEIVGRSRAYVADLENKAF